MNYFLSYPRSGRTWQRQRVKHFCALHGIKDTVRFSHIGFERYAPKNVTAIQNFTHRLRSSDNITVLLRKGEALINSYWFYCRKQYGLGIELDPFIRSDLGVKRVRDFLGVISALKKRHHLRFLHYNDAFDPHFLYNIPDILGVENNLDTAMIKAIETKVSAGYTNKRSGKPGNYKDTMSTSSQKYIREQLQGVSLAEYRERYL